MIDDFSGCKMCVCVCDVWCEVLFRIELFFSPLPLRLLLSLSLFLVPFVLFCSFVTTMAAVNLHLSPPPSRPCTSSHCQASSLLVSVCIRERERERTFFCTLYSSPPLAASLVIMCSRVWVFNFLSDISEVEGKRIRRGTEGDVRRQRKSWFQKYFSHPFAPLALFSNCHSQDETELDVRPIPHFREKREKQKELAQKLYKRDQKERKRVNGLPFLRILLAETSFFLPNSFVLLSACLHPFQSFVHLSSLISGIEQSLCLFFFYLLLLPRLRWFCDREFSCQCQFGSHSPACLFSFFSVHSNASKAGQRPEPSTSISRACVCVYALPMPGLYCFIWFLFLTLENHFPTPLSCYCSLHPEMLVDQAGCSRSSSRRRAVVLFLELLDPPGSGIDCQSNQRTKEHDMERKEVKEELANESGDNQRKILSRQNSGREIGCHSIKSRLQLTRHVS